MNMEILWGLVFFFLPLSPLDHGGNKHQHRVSLLKICRPNIATNTVAQRTLPLLMHRTFHAAAGCWLSLPFLYSGLHVYTWVSADF